MLLDKDGLTTPFEEPHLVSQIEIHPLLQALKENEGFNEPAFLQLMEDTDADTTLRILARFCQNLRETVDQLRAERLDQHSLDMQRIAHRIAGTAELLGFRDLGVLARKLQTQLKETPPPHGTAENVQRFERIIRILLKDIGSCGLSLDPYLL